MKYQENFSYFQNLIIYIFLFVILIPIAYMYPSTKLINIEKLRNLNDAPLNYIKEQIKTDKISQIHYDFSNRCCVEYEGNIGSEETRLRGIN